MDRFDRFNEDARRALELAQQEASRLEHHYIGTEHLLLGLIREPSGIAARALQRLHTDAHKVRTAVEVIISRGGYQGVGLTPRAKRVIELAVEEARRHAHTEIGAGHLLLGLAREGEGVAAGVLKSLGVTYESVTREVLSELSTGPGESAAQVSEAWPTRQRISSGSPWESRIGFSRAVRVGDRILVSGTAPIWPDGSCDPDPERQARRCIEIIEAALTRAGATLRDVVRTRTYLTDPGDADAVARAHAAIFADIRPASTMVVVAGFLDPRWKVEFEAEAQLS